MLSCTVFFSFIAIIFARPEPPSSGYSYSPPSSTRGIPGPISNSYGAPAPPQDNYGPPEIPKQTTYAAPSPSYGPPPQASIIHKHVYVHVAPPEPDYEPPRKTIVQPPAQKHYKIVFIKAPTPPVQRPPVIPPPPQNEEKTLVYVLVKKPEEQPEIVIPTPAPTLPSKPEVYFIRYRTQKEGSKGGYPESVAPADQYGPPNLTYDSLPSNPRH